MITTTDIKSILYKDCKSFEMNVHRRRPTFGIGDILKEEMIVLHTKRQTSDKYWKKSFADVNICVPDIDGEENEIRTNELEHLALSKLDNVTGIFNKTVYRYGVESVGVEADTALKCHFVNVRILFEVLNTI